MKIILEHSSYANFWRIHNYFIFIYFFFLQIKYVYRRFTLYQFLYKYITYNTGGGVRKMPKKSVTYFNMAVRKKSTNRTDELSKMMVSLNWSKVMLGLTLFRESSAQLKTIWFNFWTKISSNVWSLQKNYFYNGPAFLKSHFWPSK